MEMCLGYDVLCAALPVWHPTRHEFIKQAIRVECCGEVVPRKGLVV